MQNPVWQKALNACADRQRAELYLEQFKTTSASSLLKKASGEQARIVAALFSGSQALSEQLIAHPDWLASSLDAELLQNPRQKQGLQREVHRWLKPALNARDYTTAYARLREFKQREMLRIAARDLARLGDVTQVTREISDVADVCLDAVCRICGQQFSERFGRPYHQDPDGQWRETAYCIFGMGKLGGQELNYSSDVDVIFVYGEEGHLFKEPPSKTQTSGKGLNNHQFFKRLAETFVAEVGRLAPEGALYRIDLRLRPEGDNGPLARSVASCENYYAQWGQTWERMMLIKARGVAGSSALAAEFLEMIQPFRYPRSLGERILREVAAMKQRIETEVVKADEIDRNVKLGRGGIREIEFVAQTLQLLHAGRIPFLQGGQTLPVLEKLAQYKLLPESDAQDMGQAYCFLRDVEHRLQMENNLQTHTIPTERKARDRLAALMGFDSLKAFESALRKHTGNVRQVYGKLLNAEPLAANQPLPRDFDGEMTEWKKLLAEHSFKEVDKSFRILETIVRGPGYGHVSPHTVDLAMQLLAQILALCPSQSVVRNAQAQILSDPDRVLARLDTFVTAYGARAMLYEMWVSNPSLFKLILLLFDRSEFLAEIAIRTPDLVDELELSGRLRRRKNADETLADLRHGVRDEDQSLWLRRYHQAELMRIGLRDILGLADFEQNLTELTALADACLQYALEVVLRKNKFKSAPFVIIGLGKLGGAELNYGSDLDIIFVADPKIKNLAPLQQLAVEIMDLLSRQTEMGKVFETDARLRPDGEKGLLVNTLDAYKEYYFRRAMLWEIQSLTRIRSIAGDIELGRQFQGMAAALTDFSKLGQAAHLSDSAGKTGKLDACSPLPSCVTPDWKKQIHQMRQRIEKERTPTGKESLAIKTGAGGLMDAEFIAQTFCLANGWREPNTLHALQHIRESKALPTDDADLLIENYRQLRRIEGILRRWSFEGETLLPDEPAALYRVAVRCGFADTVALMKAVSESRASIRSVYGNVMN